MFLAAWSLDSRAAKPGGNCDAFSENAAQAAVHRLNSGEFVERNHAEAASLRVGRTSANTGDVFEFFGHVHSVFRHFLDI